MHQMLVAAERVLIRDGYHAFSTRGVAKECGVSVGHLTYYFPTKIELLRAMITVVLDRYTERMLQDLAATQPRTRADLEEFVVWVLRDTITDETSGLFRELWVMAKHDTVVACEVIKFYEDAMESFVDLMTPLYPDVDTRRLQMAAHLLVTLTEGSTVLFAGPGDRTVSFEDMLPMLTDVVFGRLTLPASVARSTDAPRRRTGTQR